MGCVYFETPCTTNINKSNEIKQFHTNKSKAANTNP